MLRADRRRREPGRRARLRRVLAGRRGRRARRRRRSRSTATVATPRKPWALAWEPGRDDAPRDAPARPGRERRSRPQPLALTTTWTRRRRPPAETATRRSPTARSAASTTRRAPGTERALGRPPDARAPTPRSRRSTSTARSSLRSRSSTARATSSRACRSAATPRGDGGAFGDVVSGPRSLAFSDDGKYAFVADTDSEDLLVVDAVTARRGHARAAAAGSHARGGRLVRRRALRAGAQHRGRRRVPGRRAATAGVDASRRTARRSRPCSTDPMPAELRLGQKLFYSANSDDVPAHAEPLGRVRHLPPRGPQRRRHVALRAGPARHADERGRHARHGLPLPHGRSVAGAGLLEDDRRRAGGRLRHHRAARAAGRCSTRSPTTSTTRSPCPVPADGRRTDPGRPLARAGRAASSTHDESACTCCHSGPAKTDSGQGQPADLAGPSSRRHGRRRPAARRGHVRDERPVARRRARRHRRRPARRLRLRHAGAARPLGLRALPARRQRGDARRRDPRRCSRRPRPRVQRRGRPSRPTTARRSSNTSAACDPTP